MRTGREQFGGRGAAILAMAGSAIGLGNIWRFPYMVGQTGGAAFIIIYLVSCLLLSMPIFLAEAIIGHRTHASTFGAMEKLAPGTKWKWLGLLTVLSPLVILSYYSVVGGWSIGYLWQSVTVGFHNGEIGTVSSAYGKFIASPWRPLLCHTLFLGACAGIVSAGVKSGIERFNKITMPLLFVLIVLIMTYSISLPGSRAGVDYLVKPVDSERLAQAKRAVAAMGGRPESGYQSHDDEFEAAQEAEAWEQGAADEGFAPAAEAAPQGAATDEAFDEISDEEIDFLWGLTPEEGAAKLLREYGVSLVYATLGPKGCYVANRNGSATVSSPSGIHVVDTTGAGDIFGGSAMSQFLAIGKAPSDLTAEELAAIVRFACTAASLSTQKHGGITSVPSREEVLQKMND